MNTAHDYEKNKDSLKLTFLPFTTFIDPLFWNRINHLKVNKWKLDESPKRITGSYTIYGDQSSDSLLCFDQNSIDEDEFNKSDSGQFWLHGTFILFNLKSVFVSDYDRKQFLEESSQSLWKVIASREWITNTQLLNPFLLTAWADIKNFVYYFWNCLPALVFPDNLYQLSLDPSPNNELHTMALNFFATNEKRPFLLIDDKSPTTLEELISIDSPDRFLLVFPNSSSVKYQLNWLVRNLIAAIAYLRTDWTSLRIFALSRLAAASFIIKIGWNPVHKIIDRVPRCVGWERNAKNKMECRNVDLKRFFDPMRILEQTVDLNLKLIRWRHAPSIDLERFTSLRVLLLGAGTLGCNIARALLGWGVKQFTFVDYAHVSYNNPIRQSLYSFDDCSSAESSKAEAAANALRRIYPLVEAKGIHMKIPMPGYPYSKEGEKQVKKDCQQLEDGIRDCDVVFLVMDSRESRWLPTLLAAINNKLAVTVALGFDDFVIIRHGSNPLTGNASNVNSPSTSSYKNDFSINRDTEVPGSQLGCYFCNDVTAPGNSTSARALDQQCTISRSGISMIASGFATELLASILQHEKGADAPAKLTEVDGDASILGGAPHQIRGFLSRFHQMMPTVRRFDRCTACGDTVRGLYRAEGFVFLDRIFKNPMELEQITGLTELQRQANEFQSGLIEMDDNESV